MIPVFAARRRADEFAALVEQGSTSGPDARYADLLEVVDTLRDAPPVVARPEFVVDLRARLMTAAETALVPAGTRAAEDVSRLTLPARKTSRDRKIAAAVGGLALVGASASMAVAAQSALPGDALYPVKRALENAHTGVAMGEADKGSTLLSNASSRLDEVGQLSRGGDLKDTLAIADTLNTFSDQSAQASDLLLEDYADHGNQASIDKLRDFTATSLDELTALEPLVPDDARDELLHAAQVVVQIDAAAHQACPSCTGGITQIPSILVPASSGFQAPPAASTSGADRGGKPKHAPKDKNSDPQLPTVDEGSLPPGSILPGSPTSPAPGGSDTDGTTDPLTTLTEGLTGGGTSQPTSNPSDTTLPGLGGVLDGTQGTVDDLSDGLDQIAP